MEEKKASIIVSEETKTEKEDVHSLKVQEYLQKEAAVVLDQHQIELVEHLEQMNRSNTDILLHVDKFVEKENTENVSLETKKIEWGLLILLNKTILL